jgi:hypothetical protein
LTILAGTTALIVSVALILGLTLLILGDLDVIQAFGNCLAPARYRPVALSSMRDVDEVIGGFVRGQVFFIAAQKCVCLPSVPPTKFCTTYPAENARSQGALKNRFAAFLVPCRVLRCAG